MSLFSLEKKWLHTFFYCWFLFTIRNMSSVQFFICVTSPIFYISFHNLWLCTLFHWSIFTLWVLVGLHPFKLLLYNFFFLPKQIKLKLKLVHEINLRGKATKSVKIVIDCDWKGKERKKEKRKKEKRLWLFFKLTALDI